jgi:hypothetical protein
LYVVHCAPAPGDRALRVELVVDAGLDELDVDERLALPEPDEQAASRHAAMPIASRDGNLRT